MQKAQEKAACTEIPLLKPHAHVHLMGICGTGMASLAGMFLKSGYKVTGSDQAAYPPMSDLLAELGIQVIEGYKPSNLDPRPDLVVVGNVIRRVNPEAVRLEESGIPFGSMPAVLQSYFTHDKTRIVVAGTHGKTTVSSMIAWILFHEGLDPGFMIGGVPRNFRRSYRLGTGRFFVIEGDEYDTAYFDKRPKFLHYRPHIAIVTSCEFDHADIYNNIQEIEDQFEAFCSMIPSTGNLIAYGDDPRVQRVIRSASAPVHTYGLKPGAEWTVEQDGDDPNGLNASFSRVGQKVASGTVAVLGYHNLLNATAAIAATAAVGVHPQRAVEALRTFQGVKRRQEILGQVGGITIIDDFAHHPTEVRATCSGVRRRFPDRRLVAVFEPRTNTSRRSIFQDLYVVSLLETDLAVLREPRGVDENPESDRFSSRRLAEELRAGDKEAFAFEDTDGILEYLVQKLQPGDVVLIMSNGSFDNLGARLLLGLKERGQ